MGGAGSGPDDDAGKMAHVAFGEDYRPCYGAYLESGLTEQQMSFDEFRESYAATPTARKAAQIFAWGRLVIRLPERAGRRVREASFPSGKERSS